MAATRSEKKKQRIEDEKVFLGAVLAGLSTGDIAAGAYSGVGWRDFADKRHQALWRAIQTLDISKDFDGRVAALMAESGREPEYYYSAPPGGGAARRRRRLELEELHRKASGMNWIERELDAAGALPLVGGKKGMKEICETCDAIVAAHEAEYRAGELGFIPRGGKEK